MAKVTKQGKSRFYCGIATSMRAKTYRTKRESVSLRFAYVTLLSSILLLGSLTHQAPGTGAKFHTRSDDYFSMMNSRPNSVSFPLYGSVYRTAYWFADIHLGYPHPQRQSLIVDTGSSVTAFRCADCVEKCGNHADAPFDAQISLTESTIRCAEDCQLCSRRSIPDSSSTRGNHGQFFVGGRNQQPISRAQCAYRVDYTEGSSLLGRWYKDHLWVRERHMSAHGRLPDLQGGRGFITPIPFGCHAQETHLFLNQEASGILGLEPENRYGPEPFVKSVLRSMLFERTTPQGIVKVPSSSPPVLPEQTAERTKPLRTIRFPASLSTIPAFALCLSESGGILTIGGYHTELHRSVQISNNSPPPRVIRSAMRRSQLAGMLSGERRQRRLERAPFVRDNKSKTDIRRRLAIVFTVNNVPPTAVQIRSNRLLTREADHLNDNEVFLQFQQLRGLHGNASKATPADEGVLQNTLRKTVWTLAVERQAAEREMATELSGFAEYEINDKNARSVACFGHKIPLRMFHAPAQLGNTSTTNAPAMRIYLAPAGRASKDVMRCLQNVRSTRPRHRDNVFPAVPSFYYSSNRLPFSVDVERNNAERQRGDSDFVYRFSQTSSKIKDSTDKDLSESFGFDLLDDPDACRSDPASAGCNSTASSSLSSTDKYISNTPNNELWKYEVDLYGETVNPDLLDLIELNGIKEKPNVVAHYIPSVSPGIQWTPFISFQPTPSGIEDWRQESYYVFLNKWVVKGLPKRQPLPATLPLVPAPAESGRYSEETRARTHGMLALVDSGTTLTYLPFLAYASIWTSMLDHLATAHETLKKEKEQDARRRRLLSDADSPFFPLFRRVHGVGFSDMERRVASYINKMERRLQRFAAPERATVGQTLKSRLLRFFWPSQAEADPVAERKAPETERLVSRMEEAREVLNRMVQVRQMIEKRLLAGYGTTVMPVEGSKENSLAPAFAPVRNLAQDNNNFTPRTPFNVTLSDNNNTSQNSSSSLDRLISSTDLGSLVEPHFETRWTRFIEKTSPLSRDRRVLHPVSVGDSTEECWLLTNGDEDFVYFAEMELQFLQGAKFVWRPKSFLYKRGKTKVYCSTLVTKSDDYDDEMDDTLNERLNQRLTSEVEKQAAEESQPLFLARTFSSLMKRISALDFLSRTTMDTSSQKRVLQTNDESAILGSSFFLYHDLIFHLGDWSLGMVEAECPATDLMKRLNSTE